MTIISALDSDVKRKNWNVFLDSFVCEAKSVCKSLAIPNGSLAQKNKKWQISKLCTWYFYYAQGKGLLYVVLGLIVLGTGFKVLKLCESRDVLAVFKTDHCQKKQAWTFR